MRNNNLFTYLLNNIMRKINIYLLQPTRYLMTNRLPKKLWWTYETSTEAETNCKTAKHNFCVRHGLDASQVKASYK